MKECVTHYACDCIMAKLPQWEKVVEEARKLRHKIYHASPSYYLTARDVPVSALTGLFDALIDLDEENTK